MIKTSRIPWRLYGAAHDSERIAKLLATRLSKHVASVKVSRTLDGKYQLYTRRGK